MATNHTENYNLNLWEPGDTFLRTEFNENTQKLDAALKAEADARSALAAGKADAAATTAALNTKADASAVSALSQTVSALIQPTPLLDFTLDVKTDLITIPITDEYRQKYRKLLLYLDLQVTGAGAGEVLVRDTGGQLANFSVLLYPRIADVADQDAFSELILELNAPVVFFFMYSHRNYPSSNPNYSRQTDGQAHYSTISRLTWSQVSQLEFRNTSGSGFLAGGRVRMFGLL